MIGDGKRGAGRPKNRGGRASARTSATPTLEAPAELSLESFEDVSGEVTLQGDELGERRPAIEAQAKALDQATPEAEAPTLTLAEPEIVPGQPTEKRGSAHARASAIAIFGPRTREPRKEFFLEWMFWAEINQPDFESEPTDRLEVIPRAQFLASVVNAGGVGAYLREKYHDRPGKYSVLWVGPQGQTCASEYHCVPDPPNSDARKHRESAARERKQAAEQERRARESRDQQEREAIDVWARHWMTWFAEQCAVRGASLGHEAVRLLDAVEEWLRRNAPTRFQVGAIEFMPTRFGLNQFLNRQRLTAVSPISPEEIAARLRMFLPSAAKKGSVT